jgi:peptidoglycan/xylan/chitin deacetylase (PgdA/CDA1 family)
MGRWKDGAQCAVMLTFDVDAETLWLAGDMANLNKPGLLSQGTYGAQVGVPLILDVLRRHDLKGTFFTPGWTAEHHSLIMHAVHAKGHEIAHHGWIHEHTTNLSRDEEEAVLVRGIEALQAITGERPQGYRSPSWELSKNTLGLLHQHGFQYSTNLMSHFIPWVHHDSGIVELPVSWLLDDAPFFLFRSGSPRPISNAENVFQAWSEEFRGIYHYGGLFNLTMHPQIIGRPGRLMMLERLITYIQTFPDVWFARGTDVATYWLETGPEHHSHHPEIRRGLSLDI